MELLRVAVLIFLLILQSSTVALALAMCTALLSKESATVRQVLLWVFIAGFNMAGVIVTAADLTRK